MKYSFGLRGHDIADNFKDMCEGAKKNGIKNLQFAIAKTISDIDFDAIGYDPEFSAKIKSSLDSYGLHVSVLGCYINPVCPDKTSRETQLRRFKNFLYYAKDFNADIIGTETGVWGAVEDMHSEENYKNLISNMLPIVREAEKIGVMVGIEPVYVTAICSPERMRRMIDDIDSDNLKVILDMSNMVYPETRHLQRHIIESSFELFGDKIKAIHLKDFKFENQKKRFAVVGKGELMTNLIFDKIASLKTPPAIILDETKLSLYNESLKSLENY